ncbi:MAG: Na/Pi cotransporter family protein, partial [Duncaniella sp.]|nr:Na/Pi cotransporter family protein [Duncaniella sp.]
AQRVQRMVGMAQNIVHTKEGSEEFSHQFSRIEKYEEISDRMELEIAGYLNRVVEGRLSNEGKHRIASLLRIVSEIESIADSCYGVAKIMIRKQENHVKFSDEIYTNVDSMFISVEAAMTNMILLLNDIENVREKDIITSYNLERETNNLRNQFRADNVENINEHRYEYQAGIYYMDIIGTLEKTGDYVINVVDEIKTQLRSTLKEK